MSAIKCPKCETEMERRYKGKEDHMAGEKLTEEEYDELDGDLKVANRWEQHGYKGQPYYCYICKIMRFVDESKLESWSTKEHMEKDLAAARKLIKEAEEKEDGGKEA